MITTQVELNVETPSLVSMRPWTIQGCRPFSVSNQPVVFMRKGAMANQVAKKRNPRARSSRCRHDFEDLGGCLVEFPAAHLEQRERARLARVPLGLGRRDLHGLVPGFDDPELAADEQGQYGGR